VQSYRRKGGEDNRRRDERTEQKLGFLVEQHWTLVQEYAKTRTHPGGLTATVGYSLADNTYEVLPALLQWDQQISVTEKLMR
jgi:hypothetical protein